MKQFSGHGGVPAHDGQANNKDIQLKSQQGVGDQNSFQIAAAHNRNTVWCGVLVQQLVNIGIRTAVLCIGGRSAALAMMLDNHPQIETIVFNDERAGAFHALGRSKVSGDPVAVCTTSGSSVANLAPALAEAKASGVPLVILSCDRPRSIRNAGAPQCADHIGMLQALVEASIDLPDPNVTADALELLQDEVHELLSPLNHPASRGPLHINIPLHGVLTSMDQESDWVRPSFPNELFQGIEQGSARALPAPGGQFATLPDALDLKPGMKGLIFVGPDAPIHADQINALAEKTRFPVLADTPSGLRRPHTIPTLIWNGDLMVLKDSIARKRPDLIIRIGEAPVSHMVQRYLQSQSCQTVVFSRRDVTQDFLCPDSIRLSPIVKSEFAQLVDQLAPGDSEWTEHWLAVAASVQVFKEEFLSDLPWGECKAASMICNAEGFGLFQIANSMSIRHTNLFCDARETEQTVLVNRGLSGIDGTISTFFGAIEGYPGRGILLLGDQAAAHDLGALQYAKHAKLPGTLCIMSNGGSAIFDLLSCTIVPDYERVFRNDPGIDFEQIAAAFRIPYERCTGEQDLAAALVSSAERDDLSILEVCVPAGSLKHDLPRIYNSMRLSA